MTETVQKTTIYLGDYTEQGGLGAEEREKLIEKLKSEIAETDADVMLSNGGYLPDMVREARDADAWLSFERAVQDHGDAFLAYADRNQSRYKNWGESEVTKAANDFQDSYEGDYADMAEWAERYVDDVYDLPDSIRCYFNFELMADDCISYGDYYTLESPKGVYVFRA